MAADPNKVYRLKTDGDAVLISDADTLDAYAKWTGQFEAGSPGKI